MQQWVRTFVAIELGPGPRDRARRLIERLRASPAKVRWIDPQNLHLTLKFLGDVAANDIPQVCSAVIRAAARVEPFDVDLRGAGAFPDTQRPRTIWIGVGAGEERLVELHAAVEDELEELGYPRDARRFRGHLTLGRVKQAGRGLAELGRELVGLSDYDATQLNVDELVVFSSELSPDGPRYEPLAHAALGGPS